MRKDERFSRRSVLRALGASTVMLPLLQSERSEALTSGTPKRLVCVTMTNGNDHDDYFNFHSGPSETLSALEPWKSQVMTIKGLGYQVVEDSGTGRFSGHRSFPGILTGSYRMIPDNRDRPQAKTASIDQIVAQHFATSVALPRQYLNLGVRSERGPRPHTVWRGDNQPNANETDSTRLFESLFASELIPPEKLDEIKARRQSVLDYLGKDLESFGTRMGTEDKTRIDAHLASIRELEVELQTPTIAVDCDSPMVELDDYVPNRMDAMFRMMSVALRCDYTRVITIELYDNGGGNGNTFPWLGVNKDYHEVAHDHPLDKLIIDKWLFEQVAILVSDLAGTVEGDGTMLDNSLIMISNDMGGSSHDVSNVAYSLVGNAGGYFNTGRHVELGSDRKPHNRLLTTVANSMGVNTNLVGTDYSGDLPELLA